MALRLLVIGDVAWDIFIRPEGDLVRGSDVLGTVDVMPGGAAVKDAAGKFLHEDAWRYLFTEPVEREESGCG